jgi:hypothetical protein
MSAAAVATLITAPACFPRLWLWSGRPNALWFMVTLLALTAFILWSFVFGWYPACTGQPVLRFHLPSSDWVRTGLLGVASAVAVALIADTRLRELEPDDYPASLAAWTAGALFSVAFSQLFLCYAPLALFLRLFRNPAIAILLTVGFGLFLLGLQLNAAAIEADGPFLLSLFGLRVWLGWAGASLFLRGGLLLATVWSLLIESRLLFY